MSDRLQDGIYFRSGEKPGAFWRLLLLNIADGTTPEEALNAITGLWTMLQALRQGRVADLNPAAPLPDDPVPVELPHGELTVLIGYGARIFDPQAHPLPIVRTAPRPPLLRDLPANGAAAPFRNLRWATEADRRQARADICLQFIAESELAVNRAIVETYKHIADNQGPLDPIDFFSGFGRDDRRSWIDFHDGINTMTAENRLKAMEFLDDEDIGWMIGGTFMAFLRIEVDLAVWRGLTRTQQELVVGRDKLTGCPLTSTQRDTQGILHGVKMTGCPMSATIPPGPSQQFLDPERPSGDMTLQLSHIHRANLNRRADPRELASNRIYRQGYEFLEPRPDGQLSLGLNFVGFQSSLHRINDVLGRSVWLGDVNFGGVVGQDATGDAPAVSFLSLVSGHYFAVPPKGEPFPGAEIFT